MKQELEEQQTQVDPPKGKMPAKVQFLKVVPSKSDSFSCAIQTAEMCP